MFAEAPAKLKREAPMESDETPEERQFVCSGCLQIVPESLIHVLPYFNDTVNRYVTTYRCETCWLPALDETRTHLAKAEDWAEISSLAGCFESHGVFLHEFRRGDPLPVVRALLVRMIEMMQLGNIRLSAGPLATAPEAETLTVEIKKNESLAEAAYDAMYDASPSSAKDYFDDARGFFTKAIVLATRAGLEDEATRLTARCDHIVNVYNSQFRRIW
jgi:hypothetical protein